MRFRATLHRRMVVAAVPMVLLSSLVTAVLLWPYKTLPAALANVQGEAESDAAHQALALLLTERAQHYTSYAHLPATDRPLVRAELEAGNDAWRRNIADAGEGEATARAVGAAHRLDRVGQDIMRKVDDGLQAAAISTTRVILLTMVVRDVRPVVRDLGTGSVSDRVRDRLGVSLGQLTGRVPATQTELLRAELSLDLAAEARRLEALLAWQSRAYTEAIADPDYDATVELAATQQDIGHAMNSLALVAEELGVVDLSTRLAQLRITQTATERDGRNVLALASLGDADDAMAEFKATVHHRLEDEAKPAAAAILDRAEELLDTNFAEAEARARWMRRAVAAGTVALWLVAGFASVVSARRIVDSLRRVEHTAERIGAGDLTARVDALGDDEVGRLGEAVNHMAGELESSRAALLSNAVLDGSPDALLLGDAERIWHAAGAVSRLLGIESDAVLNSGIDALPPGELRDAAIGALCRPDDDTVVVTHHHPERGRIHVEVRATDLRDDPDVGGCVLLLRDVTEQHEARAALHHQAFHDPLTGLANRAMLQRRLVEALRGEEATPAALLLCDLDDFKVVNDTLGHEAGDLLLVEVADRLRACLRDGDLACRLGGDEFALLLADGAAAEHVAAAVLETLDHDVTLHGRQVACPVSVGVARSRPGSETPSSFLRAADIALHHAKAAGKHTSALYVPSMSRELEERYELEGDLRDAIASRAIDVHYQAQWDADGREIMGFEALARWTHPVRGAVPPSVFVGVAEETGLVPELGRQVLAIALEEVAGWRQRSGLHLTVSVNVSIRQLQDPDFETFVLEELERSGTDPEDLVLEITESALGDHETAISSAIAGLRCAGVQFAIDDFGTGYSSFARLRTLEPAELKIDRSFVSGIGEPERNELVTAMLMMGRALRLRTVAEGVETQAQAEWLRDAGCTRLQGYLFARPLPPGEAELLLAASVPGHGPRTDGFATVQR